MKYTITNHLDSPYTQSFKKFNIAIQDVSRTSSTNDLIKMT